MESRYVREMESVYDRLQRDLDKAMQAKDRLDSYAAGYAYSNDIEWDEMYIGEEISKHELEKSVQKAEIAQDSLRKSIKLFEKSSSNKFRESYELVNFNDRKDKAGKFHSELIDLYIDMINIDEDLEQTLGTVDERTPVDIEDERSRKDQLYRAGLKTFIHTNMLLKDF